MFTNAIPNSQCVVCHIHPGTSFANTYLGYMWWDNESDGEQMYPAESHNPTPQQMWQALRRNPDSAQLKGLWGDLYPEAKSHRGATAGEGFLAQTGSKAFNESLEHNQFADFHGHGWMFRAIHKRDRQGRLLDDNDQVIDASHRDKWKMAVHLKDVHLQNGMHCVDCHFSNDVHGNGRLYGEVRNAIEITCVDCHGTYRKKTTLHTSGPAAPIGGSDLSKMWVKPGKSRKKRFYEKGGRIYQRSSLKAGTQWEIPQTVDTINPKSQWYKDNPDAGERSRYAKTMRVDGSTWGDLPPASSDASNDGAGASAPPDLMLAHRMENMECYTCHTSWMTSCFGCHLPMEANQRAPMLHNESLYTRNYTRYHFQVLRDDVFMLGRDGIVRSGKVSEDGSTTAGKIVPVRSSSAVVVSSQNQNREWVYHQQQTISGEGFSGQAFNPHFPHAVSGRGTTKKCSDCHLSQGGDNNAWMAQLLTQGTNFVNFFGRYIYVATADDGFEAVAVTEHDEPQAVYGSYLHRMAYPDEYALFVKEGRTLEEAYHHGGGLGGRILDVQQRGEYVYAARGAKGFYVYDVANIDNKGFSERIVTAPVSPLGQELGFDTKYAVAVASPTTLGVDPARTRLSVDDSRPRKIMMDEPEPWHINREQRVHPMYAYLYVGDRDEGLIMTLAATLLDGDPDNNFLQRAELSDGSTAFNPNGQLDGLTHLTIAGQYVYITAKAGLFIVDIDQPLSPKIVGHVGSDTDHVPSIVESS